MRLFKKLHRTIIHVGLWKCSTHWDILWFDQENQPHFLQHHSDNLPELGILEKQILSNMAFVSSPIKCRFIGAILPQHIWHKTLILPHPLSAQECDQQSRFMLEKELPIPLENLWFDFRSFTFKQGSRLDIFVIQQNIAQEYLQQFAPFQLDVLDTVINSIIRGFHYLMDQVPNNILLIYQHDNLTFAIQEKLQQTRFIQQAQADLTALFDQFCARFQETPQQVVVYCQTQQATSHPNHWQFISTELPLLALGNALWQQEQQHAP